MVPRETPQKYQSCNYFWVGHCVSKRSNKHNAKPRVEAKTLARWLALLFAPSLARSLNPLGCISTARKNMFGVGLGGGMRPYKVPPTLPPENNKCSMRAGARDERSRAWRNPPCVAKVICTEIDHLNKSSSCVWQNVLHWQIKCDPPLQKC